MNIYFLLEDSKSAFYVWSEWLKEMLPNFTQAFQLNDIKDYQYCIESGYGYPGHHPKVMFDEEALPFGSSIYAYMAMKWLMEH